MTTKKQPAKAKRNTASADDFDQNQPPLVEIEAPAKKKPGRKTNAERAKLAALASGQAATTVAVVEAPKVAPEVSQAIIEEAEEIITPDDFASAEDAISARVDDDALAAEPDEITELANEITVEEAQIDALLAETEDTPGLTTTQRDQVSKLQTETLVFDLLVRKAGFKRRVNTDEIIKEDLDAEKTTADVALILDGQMSLAGTDEPSETSQVTGGAGEIGVDGIDELTEGEKAQARRKLVRVTKQILECSELDAINQTTRDFKSWLKNRQLRCSLLRGGRYVIPVAYVPEVENRFKEFQAIRRSKVRAFLLVYELRIKEAEAGFAAAGISAIFRRSDFPSLRELATAFEVKREWQAFDAPKALQRINAKLWTDANEQIAIQLAGVADEAGNALRATFAGYIGWLADRLTSDEGQTKKKAIADKKVAQMLDFLKAIDGLNISKDEELTRLAEQARNVLTGVDTQKLKKDDAVRGGLQKAFTELQEATAGWVIERDRVICFNEEDV